ncbi:hypothetical protein V8G61_14600 [Gaetbulibacter sp. M240]|uniref:hypothetical protein n=1 Tax=Gaetbulibacter sp. M240 TaxID=3126511 RepID=UPI00374F4E06
MNELILSILLLITQISGSNKKSEIGDNDTSELKTNCWKEVVLCQIYPSTFKDINVDDFDNNEQLDQLIFYDFFGTNVPFASKDELTQQIPSLKKKFLNYSAFSNVNNVINLTQNN